ncbi:uncharacterized protein A4U43_C08F17670 [Asparagus officinalis]|nr:uncharacterized protein A4U43_C08F17670 [Asparagus officinalis]
MPHFYHLVPEETGVVYAQAANVADKLAGSAPAAGQVEKRKKLRKISGQGPRRAVEAEIKVVHVEDESLVRGEGVDLRWVGVKADALGEGEILVEIEVQTGDGRAQMPPLS